MLDDRVAAVKEAPPPSDVDQLRSWIGKITFYDKFLPNRATVFAPLYRLLQKDTPWVWGPVQDAAFARCKELLCSDRVLTHYSLSLPLILSVDASDYGCGCVLAHVMPDGSGRPIAFVSRTFSDPEKKYSVF